jgi:hypothetical protein
MRVNDDVRRAVLEVIGVAAITEQKLERIFQYRCRNAWDLNSRIIDPTTLRFISEDINSFDIR